MLSAPVDFCEAMILLAHFGSGRDAALNNLDPVSPGVFGARSGPGRLARSLFRQAHVMQF